MEYEALTISELYRERFYFKWIKQHLHIKSFYGTSEKSANMHILAFKINRYTLFQRTWVTDKTPLNELFNKAVPTEETEDWLYDDF